MKENGNTRYAIHDIGPDLLLVNALPLAPRRERLKQDWSMLFYPAKHIEEHLDMTI